MQYSVVDAKIKVCERTLAKKVKVADKNIKKMKLIVHETKQNIKSWKENC